MELIYQAHLGTNEITDCGATYMTEDQIRAHIRTHNADIDGKVLKNYAVGTTHE